MARAEGHAGALENLLIDGGHSVRSAATEQVMDSEAPTDREILLLGDAAGFAVFYDRHAEWVLAFARRRSPDAQSAADVTAEVFAAALEARRRYRSESPSANAWLLAIATNKLNSALRSGYAERRARVRLGVRPVEVTEDDIARIDALAEAATVVELLERTSRRPTSRRRRARRGRARLRGDRGRRGCERDRRAQARQPWPCRSAQALGGAGMTGHRERWYLDRLRAELERAAESEDRRERRGALGRVRPSRSGRR